MSLWDVITKLLPDFWGAIRERGRIKSEYSKVIAKLERNEPVPIQFDELETRVLGVFIEKKHSSVIEDIRSSGELRTDLHYELPSDDDRNRILAQCQSIRRRIFIKNILYSIFSSIAVVLLLVLIVGIAVSLASPSSSIAIPTNVTQ